VRLLVFGGFGQLGSDLEQVCAGRHELIRPTHRQVDVTERSAVAWAVGECSPDAVVDLAAFHKVEACEEDPGPALAVNAVGALNVARAARAAGARCVFVSTDYVFGGDRAIGYREDDPVAPVNAYGVSEAAGEQLVRLACPDSLIVRASGLFGHAGSSGKGGNFVESMLRKAEAGNREPISVPDDLVFAPTSSRDLAERIVLLLERAVPAGTYHAANAGSCSWYGFAQKIFELGGLRPELLPRSAVGDPVRRPARSVLLDTKSIGLGLPPSRPWEDALQWYLETRTASKPAGTVSR